MIISSVWILFGLTSVIAIDIGKGNNVSCTKDPRPVFVLHGVMATASYYEFLKANLLLDNPLRKVHLSDSYGGLASLIPLQYQIDGILGEEFQKFSKDNPCGFDFIGHSQGALLGRTLLQAFPNHNVHKFISLGGLQAGQFGVPLMYAELQALGRIPPLVDTVSALLFDPEFQKTLSVANLWNDPTQPEVYLRNNTFLPYYNNEIWTEKSMCYREGILKLKQFIVIYGPDDGEIDPWQSNDFSFYDRCERVVDITERQIFKEDRLGLRTLEKEGRFIRHVVPGVMHANWVRDLRAIHDYIIPSLNAV